MLTLSWWASMGALKFPVGFLLPSSLIWEQGFVNVETVGVETSDTGLCAQKHPPISGSLMLCSCHLGILNNSAFGLHFVGEVCFLQQENGTMGEWPRLLCGSVLGAPPLLSARSLSHTLCSLLTGFFSASLSWGLPAYSSHLLLRTVKKLPWWWGWGKTRVPPSPGCRHGESQS